MHHPRNDISIDNGPFTVPGFSLGHWTHADAVTGCTVLLADQLVPAAVDVRGAAPGTRETDLLGSGRTVQGVDAILLTGGSAFGLSAADGIVRWLREHGRGFPTSSINVPIVAGAVILDLTGDDPVWPGPDAGYAAAASVDDVWRSGRYGGGAGARNSKALGRELAVPTGIGVAKLKTPAGSVSAVIVNNAYGDVIDDRDGSLLTSPGGRGLPTEAILLDGSERADHSPNTVIGAVAVDRPVTHDGLTRIANAAHSGIARVVRPAHTPVDGDTMFALAPASGSCPTVELMQLVVGTQIACARAVVNSIGPGN